MTDPIIPIAELVAKSRYEDLPTSALAAAKTFILDTIGVGVAGAASGPRVRELIATAQGWGTGSDATVWRYGTKLPAASAALVNGYCIHALEYDCVHEPAVVHPMATMLSGLFAHCEKRGNAGRPVSGRDYMLAASLGVETAAIIGAASKSAMRFFRPATAGGFGVVSAIGAIEKLDVPTLLNAYGILYGQTSGTMQAHVEGSMVLGLQVGFNARAGLVATDLAAAGLTGPQDVLDGTYGFYKLIETESDIATWWAKLGKTWQISRLAHKPFPSGRLTHAAIDAVQRARKEHPFAAEDVIAIDCWVPPLAHRLCGRPDIPNPAPNYAKLCIAFVMATEIFRGEVAQESFGPECLVDPKLHAVAARIKVNLDGNTDLNALWPQRFRIQLKDGWVWDNTIEAAIGHPDNPLSREAHLAKFRRCWKLAFGDAGQARGEQVIAMVDSLDTLGDVRTLVAKLVA
jgi:aconitate decarboxylase